MTELQKKPDGWIEYFRLKHQSEADIIKEILKIYKMLKIHENLLVVPVGISGSGKSTFIEKLNDALINHEMGDQGYHAILSCDLIRESIYLYEDEGFKPEFESQVWNTFYSELWNAMFARIKTIIVDNPNLTRELRYPLVGVAHKGHYCIVCIQFLIDEATALQRMAQRQRKVPAHILQKQLVALELPMEYEFDYLYVVEAEKHEN